MQTQVGDFAGKEKTEVAIQVASEGSTSAGSSSRSASESSIDEDPSFIAKHKGLICGALGLVVGGLYYFIAAEGASNLWGLFGVHHIGDVLKGISTFLDICAGACFASFTYLVFQHMNLKTNSALNIFFMLLSPIAASSFFTAGMAGAKLAGMSSGPAAFIGILLFVARALSMLDGSAKLSGKLQELAGEWSDALRDGENARLTRLVITGLTSLGFSAAATDAIYAASVYLFQTMGVQSASALSNLGYTFGALGAVGTFPLGLYWIYRGLNQLTGGGKQETHVSQRDITDRYTLFAALGTIPVILGSLGSVTAAGGHMLGTLGTFGKVVRVTSSVVYAVAGGVPGLSTVFRAMSCTKVDQSAEDKAGPSVTEPLL